MQVKPGKGDQRPTTLVICVNRRYATDRPSCATRGSEALADRLEKEVTGRNLDIEVERVCCFGLCRQGPNMRLYPGGPHYYEVGEDDLPAILQDIERSCGRRPAKDPLSAIHLLGS